MVCADIAELGSGCDLRLFVIIKTSIEVSHNIADRHILETGLGERAICDTSLKNFRSPVSRRAKVKAGVGRTESGALRLDVRQHKSWEAQLALEQSIDELIVLTRECAVDSVHSTHDGAHASTNSINERP